MRFAHGFGQATSSLPEKALLSIFWSRLEVSDTAGWKPALQL